jgi:hypothetical protein
MIFMLASVLNMLKEEEYIDQGLRKPVGATSVALHLNGRLPAVGALGEVASSQVLKPLVSTVEQANCVSPADKN